MFKVLSKPNELAKRIIRGAYPEYRGRTIYVSDSDGSEHVSNYWDEGSRDYAKVVNRFTGHVMRNVQENHPYFCRSADGKENDGMVSFNVNDECIVKHCYRGQRNHIQICIAAELIPLLGEYKADRR